MRKARTWLVVAMMGTLVALVWAGSANPTHAPATPMSNTPITEAQASIEIPPPEPRPPVLEVTAFGILDDAAPVGAGDCAGHIQSAAYDLPLGRWLYAYELECHCGPNWDVGYVAAGGGLRVPLNGNLPIPSTLGPDSWHTTNEGEQPYTQDFVNFNAGNAFPTFAGDFTVSAERSANDAEFFNADGIFLNGDIAGFITTSPPQIQNGVFIGGSSVAFDLVVPQQAAVCPPGDDDDDDGSNNNVENLVGTLLGDSDSDDDGIVDGNDDSNGNGEDDEDEDDDDECPDEDDDGDGVDDEDEDDEEDDD